MLPNHFLTQDEIDGIDRQTYELRTESGFHVVRLAGEPIARIKAEKPIGPASDSWDLVYAVCAEAELSRPEWCEHHGDAIFFGFSKESEPAR